MLTINCPWCDEDAPLTLTDLEEPEASFTCPDCGTSVMFADEPEAILDPAA